MATGLYETAWLKLRKSLLEDAGLTSKSTILVKMHDIVVDLRKKAKAKQAEIRRELGK